MNNHDAVPAATEEGVQPPAFDLSIVILCRNEEGSIGVCVGEARSFLERNDIHGEVLVVDNGSQDQSAARALAAGATLVSESQPGYGNAANAGIAAARGRYIILGDGDGEHDLSRLEPFYAKLQQGWDFVIGNRLASPAAGEITHVPRHTRWIAGPFFATMGALFFGSPVKDFTCGLRGFPSASVRSLQLKGAGMESVSEMIVKASLKNMRIAQVAVAQRRPLDPDRSSHLRVWSDGWRILSLMFVLAPNWLFLYPGLLLLSLGALLLGLPMINSVEQGGQLGVYTMLIGSALSVSGAQIALFAALAGVFYTGLGVSQGGLGALLRRPGVPELVFYAGMVLALLGGAVGLWSFLLWAQADNPSVALEPRLRIAILGATLLMLGLQLIFSIALQALLSRSLSLSTPPPRPFARVNKLESSRSRCLQV